MRKRNFTLIFLVGGIVALFVLIMVVQLTSYLLLESAYQYANAAEMTDGILKGTGAIWLIISLSVGLTLMIEGIVLYFLLGTIKNVIVAKIVKISTIFNLGLTSDTVWDLLFENDVKEK